MATGDVTITRAVGLREDYLDANLSNLNSASVTSPAFSTDGDNVTFSGNFVNPSNLDTALLYRTFSGGPNSATYSQVIIRWKVVAIPPNSQFQVYIHYSNSTSEARNLSAVTTANYQTSTLTLSNSNLTIDQLGIQFQVITGATENVAFNAQADFIFIFKETLTLPSASQPLSLTLTRRIVALQIPNKEGDILQDLGSLSASLEVNGNLVSTTSPNNYTGDQWWDVLVGTWLEHNWQWLTSDRVAYKYQITDLIPTQNPGQVGYYGFKMRLRKVDIISATAQTFSSNNNPAGAIQ